MAKLIRLHLTLQRPATRMEAGNYAYFEAVWRMMDDDVKRRMGYRTVHDIIGEGNIGRGVVYYGSRDKPFFNETYAAEVDIETGRPGANVQYKRAFAGLIKQHIRGSHETFYVVGEFKSSKGEPEFRTLTARSEIPHRNLRS